MKRVLPGLIILLFLEGFTAYSQQKSPVSELLAEQKRRIETQLAKDREREAKAQNALGLGQKALADAQSQSDSASAATAQKAIGISQTALERARGLVARDLARLSALERALSWKNVGGSVAVASATKGEVFKRSKARKLKLDLSSPIVVGEEIETGANSSAEIIFSDGSRMELGPNSSFTLTESTETTSTYELLKGRIHAVVDCLKKTSSDPCSRRWRYRRGNAVIGVRGTEFDMEASADGSTTVRVTSGTVEVSATNSSQTATVGAGQSAVVMPDGTIKGASGVALRKPIRW